MEESQMATSHRVIYRNVQGRARLNFNWEPITQASAIVITAAQFNFFGGTFGAAGRPILGDANVYVTNIGPHDPEGGSGGVEFYLHADSSSPIDVMVTLIVLENVENPDSPEIINL
jgi:hypothetical protein